MTSTQSLAEAVLGTIRDPATPEPPKPREAPQKHSQGLTHQRVWEEFKPIADAAGLSDQEDRDAKIYELAGKAVGAISAVSELSQFLAGLMARVERSGGDPRRISDLLNYTEMYGGR